MRSLVLSIMTVVLIGTAYAAPFQAWLINATKKIRQDAATNSQTSIAIKAAKNEFEPFQLVFKNTTSVTLNNIDVTFSNFTSAGVGSISASNVTTFAEEYLNITSLSTTQGQTGYWPDALLPKVDAYYHETRTTFPLSVPAGWVQPFWFDVFVPAATTPGNYQATVTVTQSGTPLFTGTVNLTVWGFTLPATSSLPSLFSNSPDIIAYGFWGLGYSTQANQAAILRQFIRAGLRHRITTSPYYFEWGTWNPVSKTYSSFSKTYYDITVNGYEDGTSGDVEYGAARTTSFGQNFSSLYSSHVVNAGLCSTATEPPQDYLDEVQGRCDVLNANLSPAEKSKMSILILDEPGGGEVGCAAVGYPNSALDYNSVKSAAVIIKAAGFRTKQTSARKTELLNTTNDPPTNDYIDRWGPYFQSVVSSTFDHIADGTYTADLAAGAQLWWYQSCMTGGCGITGGSSYDGNPQYFVEYPAMYARIFPWMTYKYGVQGETYWGVATGMTSGWTTENNSPTYVAANQFTVAGDYHSRYAIGTWVEQIVGTTFYVSKVASAPVYAGGVTTVTLADSVLISPISSLKYSSGTIGDPFYSLWNRTYSKNGDGSFFYPGVVDTAAAGFPSASGRGAHTPSIGGTHDIPIESIRLKMIREGYEDYEYLKLAGQANSAATVSAVNSVVTSTYNFDQDENHLYSARESLANIILGSSPPAVNTYRISGGTMRGGIMR